MLIHFFNPGYEAALLRGASCYTPPANVIKLRQDLALLPLWYGHRADYVLVPDSSSFRFLDALPADLGPFPTVVTRQELITNTASFPVMDAAPWGLSPDSLHFFTTIKKESGANIRIPEWQEEYARLAERQTAAACLERIGKLLPEETLPSVPSFYRSVEEIDRHISQHDPPFVLKMPCSSSGRGLLWVNKTTLSDKEKGWIAGAIGRQGCVSIEQGLDKVLDFALEFYAHPDGDIRYQGISLFGTDKRGAYAGNLLQSQEKLQQMLMAQVDSNVLWKKIVPALQQVLQEVYGGIYSGFMGIDMMIYRKGDGYFIHPLVEINMRYTMGMVAIRLFQKFVSQSAKGYYMISYHAHPGEAVEQHRKMEAAHPLVLKNGRVEKGYLSLCPISQETSYRAFLLIDLENCSGK